MRIYSNLGFRWLNGVKMANQNKVLWKPGTILAPVPVVMVTCSDLNGHDNIITVAWVGTVNSEPPMLSISIRRERYSFDLISNSKKFVVNIPDKTLVKATDICGVISGKNEDKFHLTGLSKGKSSSGGVPIILECPINIECDVHSEIDLGSHVMFIGKITGVQISEKYIDESNKFNIQKAQLLGFAHGSYYQLGKEVGSFGFSVKKR